MTKTPLHIVTKEQNESNFNCDIQDTSNKNINSGPFYSCTSMKFFKKKRSYICTLYETYLEFQLKIKKAQKKTRTFYH